MTYDDFFQSAMAGEAGSVLLSPYPYQVELATCDAWPELLQIPTGVGKTAAVVLGWLYRRRFAADETRRATPRRLVYCLPMRTLVEQTRDACLSWRTNVGLSEEQLAVHVLMGGEDAGRWDEHPEREAILIGTQDMLLSRALNRGYGMSRYRWPVQFGLLHNDCQWVLDETQLMGVGVTTSAQLQGLRDRLGRCGVTHTLWMSATLGNDQLATVDHPQPDTGWECQSLTDRDRASESVQRLLNAQKPIGQAATILTPDNVKKDAAQYAVELCDEITVAHQPGTLTLVVTNRVDRARQLMQQFGKAKLDAERFLIHSRFRPAERAKIRAAALDESSIDANGPGRIVVATQAIEAGVDVSATTMFLELAPWSSCVQRLGRCNRRGACGLNRNPAARVLWIDFDTSDAKKANELSLPYEVAELDTAREHLQSLTDAGPASLQQIEHSEPLAVVHTLRKKDLLELFDTTPDIAGNDLDVSRFIRDAGNMDVQFYWREWDLKERADGSPPSQKADDGSIQFPSAGRDELCAVSIGAARDFVKKMKSGAAWRWNPLDRAWQAVESGRLFPGMTVLLPIGAGGYDELLGWTGNAKDQKFSPVPASSDRGAEATAAEESLEDDETLGAGQAVELEQHLGDVSDAATTLRERLEPEFPQVPWDSVVRAAWWHDVGKAHPVFQMALHRAAGQSGASLSPSRLWAKSGTSGRMGSARRGFRHELASALAWLNACLDAADCDLIAWLIATHHGKVRLSLRSLPNETRPEDPAVPFARGVWEGDLVPEVAPGNGDVSPPFEVNLELMELGESTALDNQPSQPGWTARMLALRDADELGPFRLAFLEALVRVADWRGSSTKAEA